MIIQIQCYNANAMRSIDIEAIYNCVFHKPSEYDYYKQYIEFVTKILT